MSKYATAAETLMRLSVFLTGITDAAAALTEVGQLEGLKNELDAAVKAQSQELDKARADTLAERAGAKAERTKAASAVAKAKDDVQVILEQARLEAAMIMDAANLAAERTSSQHQAAVALERMAVEQELAKAKGKLKAATDLLAEKTAACSALEKETADLTAALDNLKQRAQAIAGG
jgi:hypothetical protein